MFEDFARRQFSASLASGHLSSFDVYTLTPSGIAPFPTVVVMQELPGIGPQTLSLAKTLQTKGFQVVLPHLFGTFGQVSLLRNTARVFCLRKEFHLLAKNASSPIVDWLKALCRDLLAHHDARAVGVIGMCLTGNFAISLMADENVLAGVASQPSLPLFAQAPLHMSEEEIAAARARLDNEGPMLALRFAGDRLCSAEKFKAIDQRFNDDRQRIKLIELPGNGHSVLTLDLIKAGEPGQAALAQVLSYFDARLKPTANQTIISDEA